MAKLTRRRFLTQTTISAAGIGVAASAFGVPAASALPKLAQTPSAADLSLATLSEPLMLYVRDAAKGEVAFLVGTREIIRRDPVLVAHLLRGVS